LRRQERPAEAFFDKSWQLEDIEKAG